jgi:hypothetical protein
MIKGCGERDGGGRVENRDRGKSEYDQAARAKERRETNKRMRECEVEQEITRDRRGLVREVELTIEV